MLRDDQAHESGTPDIEAAHESQIPASGLANPTHPTTQNQENDSCANEPQSQTHPSTHVIKHRVKNDSCANKAKALLQRQIEESYEAIAALMWQSYDPAFERAWVAEYKPQGNHRGGNTYYQLRSYVAFAGGDSKSKHITKHGPSPDQYRAMCTKARKIRKHRKAIERYGKKLAKLIAHES